MWTGLATFFAGLFSSSKMQDTAVDAVRKLGGLDEMSSREKADFLLQYMEVTKYQSPMRRLIALSITLVYLTVLLVWLSSMMVGYYLPYTPALEAAGAIKMFMEDVLLTPFNLILSFYFVTNIAQKVGR